MAPCSWRTISRCAADKLPGRAEGKVEGNIPATIAKTVSVAGLTDRYLWSRVSHWYCRRCVGDTVLGQPILQIPEARCTELVMVEFSPSEREKHSKAWNRLAQLREQTKSGSVVALDGELRRLFNYLKFFTSHPALVEPWSPQPSNPAPQQTQTPQQHSRASQQPQPETQTVAEAMDTSATHYFCRLCCNVLVAPLLGKVSTQNRFPESLDWA
jgi:hypothetical protein